MNMGLPGLLAESASEEIPLEMRIYDQMIGDWDFEWRGYGANGAIDKAMGEWFFRWALDGNAIQDTWICPSRTERGNKSLPKGEWGTTLRFFVPQQKVWRVTWIGPQKNSIQVLTARTVKGDIIQEGTDALGRLVQWNLCDIRPNSFTWKAIASEDGGKTWLLLQDMAVWRKGSIRQVAPDWTQANGTPKR